MSELPKVSIGLPVYNGESFLKEAVESILSQSFIDFELIIADNDSTDATAEICQNYAHADSRITYIRNETNIGAARNYNLVFSMAKGEYFKWAAADDICHPDFVKKCVEVLQNHPEVVLAYPRAKIIDEQGVFIRDFRDRPVADSAGMRERFTGFLYGLKECTPVFGLIRQEILGKTGLIGSYISSDKNLMLELSLYGQLYEVPDFLFYRRDHARASTRAHHDLSGQRDDELLSAWYDPKNRAKLQMPWWRKLFELFRIVEHSKVKVKQKLQLRLDLLRYGLWQRELLFADLRNVFRQVAARR